MDVLAKHLVFDATKPISRTEKFGRDALGEK
jgi:hypothetical protein